MYSTCKSHIHTCRSRTHTGSHTHVEATPLLTDGGRLVVHVEADSGRLHHVWRDAKLDSLVEVRSGAMVLDQGVVHFHFRLTNAWHDHILLEIKHITTRLW